MSNPLSMETGDLLFVGVKGHVAAFNRQDGSLIWKTQLKGAFLAGGERFVTLLVDGDQVYAHSYGKLFCLNAATGEMLWSNELEGLSYDIASLAIEGGSSPMLAAQVQRRRESERNSGSGAS